MSGERNCEWCINRDYCLSEDGYSVFALCHADSGEGAFRHVTNADRIRAMNDDELAMFLQDIFYITGDCGTSIEWWANWLLEEADENE